MYYQMDTDGEENTYMRKQPGLNGHVGLGMGRPWDVTKDEIELPYRFSMSVVEGEDPKLYAWYPGSHLMKSELVAALISAGVDNLQTFPAEIRQEQTGALVMGYQVVNIVGRVSCADLPRSESEPLADVYYFHDLVIDPRRIGNLLIFRLHESPMVVMVHEKPAKLLQESNFLGLRFEAVSETPQA